MTKHIQAKDISIKNAEDGHLSTITYLGSDSSLRSMDFSDSGIISKYTISRGSKKYTGFYEDGYLKNVSSSNPIENVAINFLMRYCSIYTDTSLILKRKEAIKLSDHQK